LNDYIRHRTSLCPSKGQRSLCIIAGVVCNTTNSLNLLYANYLVVRKAVHGSSALMVITFSYTLAGLQREGVLTDLERGDSCLGFPVIR